MIQGNKQSRSLCSKNVKKRCEAIVMMVLSSDPATLREMNSSQLSRQFTQSSCHLRRTFRKHTGISLRAFIKQVKLLKSAFLLLTDETLTIRQVAKIFGFSSVDYFYLSFRQFFFVTPGKWRELWSEKRK